MSKSLAVAGLLLAALSVCAAALTPGEVVLMFAPIQLAALGRFLAGAPHVDLSLLLGGVGIVLVAQWLIPVLGKSVFEESHHG